MTYEEAIKWLKEHHCPDDWKCDCKDTEAMRVAIGALEKQIPKKYELRKASAHVIAAVCPTCGEIPQNNYCHNCGQAIDWSDDE